MLKKLMACLHVFVFTLIQPKMTTGLSDYSSICKNNYFLCENSTTCIPQSDNCNGKNDCPNGSDEKDCSDDNTDNFWDRQYTKRISAQFDDDNNTDCNFTYTILDNCECRGADILCPHENLTRIPQFHIADNIEIRLLNFEGNYFLNLTNDFLTSIPVNVQTINLAYCNIAQVQPNAFHSIRKTVHLHLDNNNLISIHGGIFPDNNSLKTLTLKYNQINEIYPEVFHNLNNLKTLDLRGNKLSEIKRGMLEPLKNLAELHLQDNEILFISAKTFPLLNLTVLSLNGNKITVLDRHAFATLYNLQHLYLSNNFIRHLVNETFWNLTHLQTLILKNNFIKTIEPTSFNSCFTLTTLNLEGNNLKHLKSLVFEPLQKLDHIYFDEFDLCESVLHVHVRDCWPKGDGISSQDHLLDNSILRTSVWIMGIIGCTGNILVLLGRIFARTNNVVHSMYLRNLALSDLLMGFYLFSIAFADHSYRGVYLRHQYTWRHSYMCNLCGFLSTLSCESSVLILTLVTWDRFVSVTQPLARKQLSEKTAALTLVVLWLVAAAVSIAPFAQGYFGDEFYGNNGVCLPLHIHEPYAKGWEYSAGMFMLTNTLALVFICYAYARMIKAIRESSIACRSTRQSRERDKVAQRFGIIVLTDSACWVPVIIIKLIALAGHQIPETLYAWLAIFILPINSALNPVLYTLTTSTFTKQMRKMVGKCVARRRRIKEPEEEAGGGGHSNSESGFSLSFGVFPSSRRILSYRGTQSSVITTSKNSWKRNPTAV